MLWRLSVQNKTWSNNEEPYHPTYHRGGLNQPNFQPEDNDQLINTLVDEFKSGFRTEFQEAVSTGGWVVFKVLLVNEHKVGVRKRPQHTNLLVTSDMLEIVLNLSQSASNQEDLWHEATQRDLVLITQGHMGHCQGKKLWLAHVVVAPILRIPSPSPFLVLLTEMHPLYITPVMGEMLSPLWHRLD